MSAFGKAAVTDSNPNKSAEVVEPQSDSISSLSFSSRSNLLIATSWDNQVRCWEIVKNGDTLRSVPKASISHEQPVLCSAWKDDGTAVFSCGCDKQAKMWPLAGGQPVTVAMHDAPIKEISWISEMNLLVTGSWDKTIKYWDTRQPNPLHTQQIPGSCYALAVQYPLMVVGTSDRSLVVFNLQNPQTEKKRIVSQLKYQTRCLAALPDKKGFLVGSIEGRVGVQHLEDASKTFNFKCHRHGPKGDELLYSVNSIKFHPVHHTLATTGSDGAFTFWDKDTKTKLQGMARCNQPISCGTFNSDGSIYAYAACYDWSKGAENHNPQTAKPSIFLHLTREADVKPKPKPRFTMTNTRRF